MMVFLISERRTITELHVYTISYIIIILIIMVMFVIIDIINI